MLAASLLVLAGCANVAPSSPQRPPWPADMWTLQGRFSVESGDERASGSIHWTHRDDHDEVLLASPLGQAVARIELDPEGASLERPGQPLQRASDADALTREALGYTLPVAGLAWWVQGRPDPARPYEATHDEMGRLAELRQDGWIIEYQHYADTSAGYPRKLRVTRKDLAIRLVADSWENE